MSSRPSHTDYTILLSVPSDAPQLEARVDVRPWSATPWAATRGGEEIDSPGACPTSLYDTYSG